MQAPSGQTTAPPVQALLPRDQQHGHPRNRAIRPAIAARPATPPRRPRQRGLGGEQDRLRHPGHSTTIRIISPTSRQIDLLVDQRVPVPEGVGQEHGHLAVVDASRRSGVWALNPDRAPALLQVGSVVDLCRCRHRSTQKITSGSPGSGMTSRSAIAYRCSTRGLLDRILRVFRCLPGFQPLLGDALLTEQHPSRRASTEYEEFILATAATRPASWVPAHSVEPAHSGRLSAPRPGPGRPGAAAADPARAPDLLPAHTDSPRDRSVRGPTAAGSRAGLVCGPPS